MSPLIRAVLHVKAVYSSRDMVPEPESNNESIYLI